MESLKVEVDSRKVIAEKDDSSTKMENYKNFSKNLEKPSSKGDVIRERAMKTLQLAEAQRNATKHKLNSIVSEQSLHSIGCDFSKLHPGLAVNSSSCKSLNISDLQEDNTINLEFTNKMMKTPDHHRLTFEPTEITGRSTADSTKDFPKDLSVEDILASSCSGNVRSLSESLRDINKSYLDSGTNCSRFSSLPKTADMSKISSCISNSFGPRVDESGFSSENFVPAEMMDSKLLTDQMEWEKECAYIPRENRSISFKENTSEIEYTDLSALTNFFRKKSEDLYNMVGNAESPVRTEAHALIDDTLDSNSTKESNVETSMDSFCLLSMSKISKALENLQSDEDPIKVLKKAQSKLKPKKTQLVSENNKLSGNKLQSMKSSNNNYATNKENDNPTANLQFVDTVTFTESLLDSTDFEDNQLNSTPIQPFDEILQNKNDFLFQKSTLNELVSKSRKRTRSTTRSPSKSKDKLSGNALRSRSSTSRNLSPSELDNHNTSKKEYYPFSQMELSPGAFFSSSSISSSDFPQIRHKSSSPKCDENKNSKIVDHLQQPKSKSPLNSTPKKRSLVRSSSPHSQQSSPQFYSPHRLQTSSPRYNSPTSIALETTTSSDRRYLMAGAGSSQSTSPDLIGKMSLPNYCLASRQPSRSNSQCSTSSEFCHRDGSTLPIKVTALELSWGSTKLRTNSKKTVQVKNCSDKRLTLRLTVTGPGFQVISLADNSNLITLQSQEIRTIVLNFGPTMIGAAIGTLKLSAGNISYKISLNGYGGHVRITPRGIQKGPIGEPFITLGEFEELSHPLVKTFTICNQGPLDGFVSIILNSNGLVLTRLCDSIEIKPSKAIIPAEGSVRFQITFKPRRDDLKKMVGKLCNVMTVAHLRILSGDEPTRQRIRKIINEMTVAEKSKLSSYSLDSCWKNFEGEKTTEDLLDLRERADVAMELVSTLRTHDISLTLNYSIFTCDTLSDSNLVFPDIDETIMFKTIVLADDKENGQMNEITSNKNQIESWSVRPNILELDLNEKNGNYTFFSIRSFYSTMQYFEVTSNYKNIFTITPIEGQLSPGEAVDVNVIISQHGFLPTDINITVYIENEKITIPVKIKNKFFCK